MELLEICGKCIVIVLSGITLGAMASVSTLAFMGYGKGHL